MSVSHLLHHRGQIQPAAIKATWWRLCDAASDLTAICHFHLVAIPPVCNAQIRSWMLIPVFDFNSGTRWIEGCLQSRWTVLKLIPEMQSFWSSFHQWVHSIGFQVERMQSEYCNTEEKCQINETNILSCTCAGSVLLANSDRRLGFPCKLHSMPWGPQTWVYLWRRWLHSADLLTQRIHYCSSLCSEPLSLITIQETILSFTTSDPPNPTSKNCSKLYWHISCEISTKQRASLVFNLNSPATTQDVLRARHSRNQSHTLRLSRAWDYWWECSKEWRSDRGNVEAVQTDLPFIVSKMSASKFHGAKAWRKAR
jgi:hypothetical protein